MKSVGKAMWKKGEQFSKFCWNSFLENFADKFCEKVECKIYVEEVCSKKLVGNLCTKKRQTKYIHIYLYTYFVMEVWMNKLGENWMANRVEKLFVKSWWKKCIVYIVQCAMCSVQCTLNSVQNSCAPQFVEEATVFHSLGS